MMSLYWDSRTVLASQLASVPVVPVNVDDANLQHPPSGADNLKSGQLVPIDIWNYLISLSSDGLGPTTSSKPDHATLRHFKVADFGRDRDGILAKYVGEGASYSVGKCIYYDEDGKPLAVAVKKVKIFQDHGPRDEAGSAAHQRAVATVLKELRILTHPPLRSHLNIVSLLGYRSDFASRSLLSRTDVYLVAEFAPFGTLRDLFQHLGPDESLDLSTKAHFMHDIASAIEALHKCGIAHGDVKMENTLVFEGLARPYVAKLSDFSHSLVDLHIPERRSQIYLGTSIFNAPEIRSRSHPVAMEPEALFKCDIYSFGLLCWELVLGGQRYYKTLGDMTDTTEDMSGIVSRLSALPKTELLWRSIISLRKSHGSEDAPLVQVVHRVLQACLKDDPADREDSENIVKYFHQQQRFRQGLGMRQPGSSSALAPFVGPDRPSAATSTISQMPLVVQDDLVDQLRRAVETSTSDVDKRSSLYDLAMCYLCRVGTEKVDISKALGLMAEAARMGSREALAVVFRLHDALLGETPVDLWDIDHPITSLEKSLSRLDSQSYFAERLRMHEEMEQADALTQIFDIRRGERTILRGVRLLDAHTKLQGLEDLCCAKDLECISCLEEEDGMPKIQGNLSVTAARLGLLPLVECLLPAHPAAHSSTGSLAQAADNKAWGQDLLVAACRGGHVDMVRMLLGKGIAMPSGADKDQQATPLHWLGSFAPEEASIALELLVSAPGGKECLLGSPGPGIQMGDCMVSGTPLEVAIATNNGPLVNAFLQAKLDLEPQEHPRAIGWTTNTYPLAVALNLHHMLPHLLGCERSYRDSLWTTPTLPALGLFDLVHPHDPLLPLMIHGRAAPRALDSTIDFVLGTGGASLDDESPDGITPLAHAVRHAPCRLSLDPIPALIARGAGLGSDFYPPWVALGIARRDDAAAPAIVRLLLEEGLLPLEPLILEAPIRARNTAVAAAVLDARVARLGLDVNEPVEYPDDHDYRDGRPPPTPVLMSAVNMDHAAMVRLLLDRGARLDARLEGRTALSLAVARVAGDVDGDVIDLLLARGPPDDPEWPAVLDIAAISRSTVRGAHVLFHLLRHERIRALVNGEYKGWTPLGSAVNAANAPAVHALLQAGARLEPGEMLDRLLCEAVDAGRRPPAPFRRWGGKRPDRDELYQWRLDMEDTILTLLDKGDPGHGRARLHVAVQLGNRQRVVELVEQQGEQMLVGDREKKLPEAFLEDLRGLDESGDDEEYVNELRQLHEFVRRKMDEETSTTAAALLTNPDALQNWLWDHPPSLGASARLESVLEKVKLEKEETGLSVIDGTESPADFEAKLRKALELQRQELGDTDPRTLHTMTNLVAVLAYRQKFEEAGELSQIVLAGQQAQLPPNHANVFEALIDKTFITMGLGSVQEANDDAVAVARQALDTFGRNHHVTIRAETVRANAQARLGNHEEAIKIQEAVLQGCLQDPASAEGSEGDDCPDTDSRIALFYLGASLVHAYCQANKLEAAAELAMSLPPTLHVVKADDFMLASSALMELATALEHVGQLEAAESILTALAGTCLEVYGRRKCATTRVALDLLARHYRQRLLWEKEAGALQKLVEQLASTLGHDNRWTIDQKRDLATALAKCGSWAEASLLQEEVLVALEQRSSPRDALGLAAAKFALCESLRLQGQLEQSEAYGWEAVSAYRAELGADHETTLRAELEVAGTLSLTASKSAQAIGLLQGVVAATVRSCGEIHSRTSVAVQTLCGALVRAQRLDEAKVQAERCLHINSSLAPDTRDETAFRVLWDLASYRELGPELDAARKRHADSLKRLKTAAPAAAAAAPRMSETLDSMCLLIRLHLEAHDYSAAEPLAREVLAVAAPDSVHAQQAANFLGAVCENTDRIAEAVVHFQAAAESSRRMLGDAAGMTMNCLEGLLRVLTLERHTTEALKLATELLPRLVELHGDYHSRTIDTKNVVCFIYPDLGFWPEAERMQRDVLRFFEALDAGELGDAGGLEGPWELEHWSMLFGKLVESCSKQGRLAEAEVFGRRAVDLQLTSVGIEDVDTLQAMVALARVLVDIGEVDEAEEMLDLVQDTCDGFFSEEDKGHRDMAKPARAYLLFKQGRLDEAAELQWSVVTSGSGNLDALLFLVQLCEKLGRYKEACNLMGTANSLTPSKYRSAGGNLENIWLVKGYIQDMRLKTVTGNTEAALKIVEDVLARTEGWLDTNYALSELHLEYLQAAEALYEALGQEQDVLHMRLKIREHTHGREQGRKLHLEKLKAEKERFEKFKAGLVRPRESEPVGGVDGGA